MLISLLGNKSAEQVMTAIYLEKELHASAIAKKYQTSLDPIIKQLEKFEEAGFLKSRLIGRSRLYMFDDTNPLIKPLKELIMISINNNKELKNEII